LDFIPGKKPRDVRAGFLLCDALMEPIGNTATIQFRNNDKRFAWAMKNSRSLEAVVVLLSY
jgi:hypothetical protein